jgi:FkbM family methyltransferase
MAPARFYELNHHIPKLQLMEVFPLTPFLDHYQDMTVFDVGANTGLWSEAFLKTQGARTGRHVMFEPMQGNLDHLTRRDTNILGKLTASTEIVPAAMGAAEGEVEIHFDKDTTTLASISNTSSDLGHRVVELGQSRTVPLTTVDAQVAARGIEQLHLLKIDVEGYEMQVLKGAEAALRAGRIRNIFFEFGVHQTQNGESFRDFFEMLSRLGFQIYKSARGRNFFGVAHASRYTRDLEPTDKAVEMVLASMDGPHPGYGGPRVVGKIN